MAKKKEKAEEKKATKEVAKKPAKKKAPKPKYKKPAKPSLLEEAEAKAEELVGKEVQVQGQTIVVDSARPVQMPDGSYRVQVQRDTGETFIDYEA